MASARDAFIQSNKLNVRSGPIRHTTVEQWADSQNIRQYGTLCGSYRRGCAKLNDIDLLVPAESLSSVCDALAIKLYRSGDTMCSGFVKIGRTYCPIDVLGYSPENRIHMLLYFTGNREFNIRMRAIAKNKGYLLNQYGLFKKTGQRVPIRDERDIFKKLNITYVRTDQR